MSQFSATQRLLRAAKAGDAAALKTALDAGADPNYADLLNRTPLWWAAQGGHTECVRILLEVGVDPNWARYWDPPLEWPAREGHTECVQLLLAAGANPNRVNTRGETILEWAVWRAIWSASGRC